MQAQEFILGDLAEPLALLRIIIRRATGPLFPARKLLRAVAHFAQFTSLMRNI
jgi:hypothetical protein